MNRSVILNLKWFLTGFVTSSLVVRLSHPRLRITIVAEIDCFRHYYLDC